jgi:type IV pilus assembly protein PilB
VGGRLKLGQILVNRGLLHPDQLAAALADQQESGARLGMTLVRLGFVDEETLIRTLAGQVKLPVARIRGKRVSPDVLECIPVDLAEKHRCLPLFFKQEGGQRVLFVAMEDPSDSEAIDAIASDSGQVLRPVLVGPTELEEALQRHYHWASLTGEAPEWLSVRSPGEGSASGGAEPEPSAASEATALPEEAEEGGEEWAGEPDSDADEDLDTDDIGLGLDFDSDPGDESELEEDSDPLAAALPPESQYFGAFAEADTAPELPGSATDRIGDGDAGDRFEIDADLGLALPPPEPSADRVPRPESLDPGIILRALSQLLVEKGVISRDELVQRLGELAAREAGRG